jgi:hypothetical protein
MRTTNWLIYLGYTPVHKTRLLSHFGYTKHKLVKLKWYTKHKLVKFKDNLVTQTQIGLLKMVHKT